MGSQGPAIGVQEAAGLRAQGSGLRAQGSGLRAQGSGLRAQGSGIAEPEQTVNDDRKHCKDLTKERA